MISEKMKPLVNNNSAIRAMFEEGKKMAQKYGAENVYDFSLGNPSTLPPKAVNQAIIDVVNNEEPNRVHGYMNNSGFEDVRDAIAKSLNERFETDFSEKNILMTVGAAGGLNVILKSIIDPGDEVITFAPYFGEYNNYVANFDGKVVAVSPNPPTFQPNIKEFSEKITALGADARAHARAVQRDFVHRQPVCRNAGLERAQRRAPPRAAG